MKRTTRSPLRRRLALGLALLMTAAAPAMTIAGSGPAAAAGPTRPVGVKITRVHCTSPCDENGLESTLESKPDFYAKLFVNGHELPRSPRAPDDQDDVRPNWVLTDRIPVTDTSADLTIQIWDYDSTSGDDLADASPAGNSNLDLHVNLLNGTYTGGANFPATCAQGNGNGDGDVEVCFELVLSDNGDYDGDSLTDAEEIRGIDANGDATVDYRLAGADYRHKDLYVESDWVEEVTNPATGGITSFKPTDGTLPSVVSSFAAAPVSNPDGTSGITLHADLGEAVRTPVGPIRFETRGMAGNDDFDDFKLDRNNGAGNCPGTFGTPAERALPDCANALAAKKSAYRYMWFGDRFASAPGSSGNSELSQNGGNDFLVTLGGWSAAGITAGGGQTVVEAGTYMHELGHDLGLGHGGRPGGTLDNTNCKPNYLSVMSYFLQTESRVPGRPLDYSRQALPDLDEGTAASPKLDESKGIQGPAGRTTAYSRGSDGSLQTAAADGSIDWDGNGSPTPNLVSADINLITGGNTGCDASPSEALKGAEDWNQLHYEVTDAKDYADGVSRTVPRELTVEQVLRMASPDLGVTLAGPTDASPGDSLSLTATAVNHGPGNASDVSLSLTPPGEATGTTAVGSLAPQASASRSATHSVPCSAADGSVVVTTASVSGHGDLGQPELNPANDDATLNTTVHTPVLTMNVDAPATVDAGSQAVIRLIYGNSGSAAATGLSARLDLAKGVYYSTALDTGAGPRPDSVTRNADGTTTLRWKLPDLPAGTGTGQIGLTVRPGLLVSPGTSLVANAGLTVDRQSCPALALTATGTTKVTVPRPDGNPLITGLRAVRPATWTAENRARIQATDQRYDGVDRTAPNGDLSTAEVGVALLPPKSAVRDQLTFELLGTYFNLAERHFNGDTKLSPSGVLPPGVRTAADACIRAQALLDQPVTSAAQERQLKVDQAQMLAILNGLNAGRR